MLFLHAYAGCNIELGLDHDRHEWQSTGEVGSISATLKWREKVFADAGERGVSVSAKLMWSVADVSEQLCHTGDGLRWAEISYGRHKIAWVRARQRLEPVWKAIGARQVVVLNLMHADPLLSIPSSAQRPYLFPYFNQ
jgi:hypothetical protein